MEFDVFINTILNNDYYSNKKRGYWTELIHSIRNIATGQCTRQPSEYGFAANSTLKNDIT